MCKGQGVGESSMCVGSREVFRATGGNREGLVCKEDRKELEGKKGARSWGTHRMNSESPQQEEGT